MTDGHIMVISVADDFLLCEKAGCPIQTRFVIHVGTFDQETGEETGPRELSLCTTHIAGLLDRIDLVRHLRAV